MRIPGRDGMRTSADYQAVETHLRVLYDTRPSAAADAAFLFAQSADNQRSVLDAARHLMAESLTRRLLLVDAPANAGYAGADAWEIFLVEHAINSKQIGRVPLNASLHNTLTEADALIHFAKERRYGTLIITAAPFHQTRAFMTTVRCALLNYPRLKVFSYPGTALDWMEPARHSQGSLEAPRWQFIQSELERIDRYGQKGDLISYSEALDYLNKRDILG